MVSEPENLARSIILQFADKEFRENPEHWIDSYRIYNSLEEELKKYGIDTVEKTSGLLMHMAEEGQLRQMDKDFYVITSKGVKDLSTIYNDEWVVWQMDDYQRDQHAKQSEDKQKYELEERRHQEQVKAAREGNKLQKYGVWVAMALGAAGLLIAIFKP